MLTNVKLENVKLTKENTDLKKLLVNYQNTQNFPVVPSPTSDLVVSKKYY